MSPPKRELAFAAYVSFQTSVEACPEQRSPPPPAAKRELGARDEIESFLAELAGNPTTAGQVAPLLQWLHNSDDPAAIQFCDAVCAVIRRKELSVRERANELRPILIRLLDLLESRH